MHINVCVHTHACTQVVHGYSGTHAHICRLSVTYTVGRCELCLSVWGVASAFWLSGLDYSLY